jgi:aminopeptidase N
MKTFIPHREFLIQSLEGNWARCILVNNQDFPLAVQYSAQIIVEIKESFTKVCKNRNEKELVLPYKWKDTPVAKRLIGIYKSNLTAMMIATLGKEDKSNPMRMCFAYADNDSGFYVGLNSREFTDVVAT